MSTGLVADQIVNTELTIVGAMGVDKAAYSQALEILATDPELFAAIPRGIAGLADLESLLAPMAGESTQDMPLHGVFVPNGVPRKDGS